MNKNKLINELNSMWVIAKKDIKIYYSKPPVLMFGLIWPLFMFLSFLVKRNVNSIEIFGNLVSMTLFFMASSIGPVVIPIEKRQGTYDRLLTAPLSLPYLIIGKTIPGMIFGIVIALVPLFIGILFGAEIVNLFLLSAGILIAGFSFSALGILFSSFQVQSTGSIMIGTNMIRLPSIFISGIFLPLNELPDIVLIFSILSPLTYFHDLNNWGFEAGIPFFPWAIDIIVLLGAGFLFIIGSVWLQERARRSW